MGDNTKEKLIKIINEISDDRILEYIYKFITFKFGI